MATSGEELLDAILEVLTDHSLTLAQLVDKLQELPRWRRTDARLVKQQLQKLEDSYHIIHEREGAAVRYRWFSPKDAHVIADRNERRRKNRTTTTEMLVREGLTLALRAESLVLIRVSPNGGIIPLSREDDEAAQRAISRTIALSVETALATKPRHDA